MADSGSGAAIGLLVLRGGRVRCVNEVKRARRVRVAGVLACDSVNRIVVGLGALFVVRVREVLGIGIGLDMTSCGELTVLEAPLALKRPAMSDSALSMVVAPVRAGAGSALCTAASMRACLAGFSASSARASAAALAALAALALALLADLGAGAFAQSRFQWPALYRSDCNCRQRIAMRDRRE